MLINISNHLSERWNAKQKAASTKYGEVVDIPFPEIDPHLSSEKIDALVDDYFQRIMAYSNPTVMLQGEFIFTYRLINRLKSAGITVLAAVSDRRTIEYIDESGNTFRSSEFDFVDFKEY